MFKRAWRISDSYMPNGFDARFNSVVVDVERPGLISFGLARQLSSHMGARYFKIEDLRADVLVDALREGQN